MRRSFPPRFMGGMQMQDLGVAAVIEEADHPLTPASTPPPPTPSPPIFLLDSTTVPHFQAVYGTVGRKCKPLQSFKARASF